MASEKNPLVERNHSVEKNHSIKKNPSEKNPSIYYDRSTIGSSEELDEYGVWVKSEPQDLSLVNTDTLETGGPEEDFSPESTGDLPDFNETELRQTGVSADMTELADFNITSADDSGSLDDLNWFDGDLAFTPGDVAEESAILEPVDPDAGAEEQAPVIEDTDAFGDDGLSGIPMDEFLLEPEPENEVPDLPPEVEEPESSGELSTRLLMKIAEELSSIKDELSGLKKELYHIKSGAAEPAEQSGGGGFFDEEEDEKIALTGDELDNILKEAGTEDENPDGTGSFSDFLEQGSEQGSETGEIFFPDAGAPGEDILNLPAENAEVSLELEQLRETGVEPLTPVPEDMSFLDGEPEAMDLTFSDLSEDDSFNSSFDSSFDFDDAVIEEPDLNGELKENPIEEPSLENLSLELDMEIPPEEDKAADLPDDGDDGAIEEIELSLDDSSGSDGLVPDELSGEFSPDDALLDTTADISLDDLIDLSSDDETEAAGDTLSDDTYDQVIPENFLVESEDSPAPEEILESADAPFILDDILDTEDIPDDPSITTEAAGEIDAREVPSGEDEGTTEAESDVEPAENSDEEPAAGETSLTAAIPTGIRNELRSVLSYMDQLLESLPEDKIEEFAKSEHFDTYKKLFEDLGLV
jgi:hypothetical protein